MIWYDKPVTIKNQPDNVAIRIIGYYQEPQYTNNKVGIAVILKEDEQEEVTILHTHDPSGLAYEDPSAEDVLAKYEPRIRKIEMSFATRDLKSTKTWLKSLSRFIRGRSSSF